MMFAICFIGTGMGIRRVINKHGMRILTTLYYVLSKQPLTTPENLFLLLSFLLVFSESPTFWPIIVYIS